MKIGLVVVAYNSGRDIRRLFDSACQECRFGIHFELFLHSSHEETVKHCTKIASAVYRDHKVSFHDLRYNAGVARAWNTGTINAYAAGCARVIICNDDVLFTGNDFSTLVNASLNTGDDHFITTCSGHHVGFDKHVESHGFSCFALNPLALRVVGCFDENFHPAYFEDTDYWRRAMLLGMKEYICKDTAVRHIGSATIQRDPIVNQQNGVWFNANGRYYIRKWGGLPDHETHERPFGIDKFSLRIDSETRSSPYGNGFDRTDKDVITQPLPMFA